MDWGVISVTNASASCQPCRARRPVFDSRVTGVASFVAHRRCESSSVDRLLPGKSARKWPPRDSSRRSAALAMSQPTVARLERACVAHARRAVDGRARATRRRATQADGVPHRDGPDRRHRSVALSAIRPATAVASRPPTRRRVDPTRDVGHLARRRRLAASPAPRARRRPALRAANCSPADWRRARRCTRPRRPHTARAASSAPQTSVSTPPMM